MIRFAPLALLVLAMPVTAQTNGSVTSTREAYGVRLDRAAQPNNINPARVNNRINNRIENRLSLRIERYRLGQTEDPTAAFKARVDDGSRSAPVIAPQQVQQQTDDPR